MFRSHSRTIIIKINKILSISCGSAYPPLIEKINALRELDSPPESFSNFMYGPKDHIYITSEFQRSRSNVSNVNNNLNTVLA